MPLTDEGRKMLEDGIKRYYDLVDELAKAMQKVDDKGQREWDDVHLPIQKMYQNRALACMPIFERELGKRIIDDEILIKPTDTVNAGGVCGSGENVAKMMQYFFVQGRPIDEVLDRLYGYTGWRDNE